MFYVHARKRKPAFAGNLLADRIDVRPASSEQVEVFGLQEGDLIFGMEEVHVFLRAGDVSVELVVGDVELGHESAFGDAFSFQESFHELGKGEGFSHFHIISSKAGLYHRQGGRMSSVVCRIYLLLLS